MSKIRCGNGGGEKGTISQQLLCLLWTGCTGFLQLALVGMGLCASEGKDRSPVAHVKTRFPGLQCDNCGICRKCCSIITGQCNRHNRQMCCTDHSCSDHCQSTDWHQVFLLPPFTIVTFCFGLLKS